MSPAFGLARLCTFERADVVDDRGVLRPRTTDLG